MQKKIGVVKYNDGEGKIQGRFLTYTFMIHVCCSKIVYIYMYHMTKIIMFQLILISGQVDVNGFLSLGRINYFKSCESCGIWGKG